MPHADCSKHHDVTPPAWCSLQDNDTQIATVWPVHGGVLSLCGDLNFTANKTRVGIDTETG